MESDEKPQVALSIESDGHKRFLVAREGSFTARVRIPLHLVSIGESEEHLLQPYCAELYAKLATEKAKGAFVH